MTEKTKHNKGGKKKRSEEGRLALTRFKRKKKNWRHDRLVGHVFVVQWGKGNR